MALNEVTKLQHRRRHESRRAEQTAPVIHADAAEGSESAELLARLDLGLASLSETDRQILVERYFRGSSVDKIAATAGLTEVAARRRINRAVEKLRRTLSPTCTADLAMTAVAAAAGYRADARLLGGVHQSLTQAAALHPVAAGTGLVGWISTAKTVGTIVLIIMLALATGYSAHFWPGNAAPPPGPSAATSELQPGRGAGNLKPDMTPVADDRPAGHARSSTDR